jgi:ADP-heptose:LPS heptosyltransferase
LKNLLIAPNAVGDIILASELLKKANEKGWLIFILEDFSNWAKDFVFKRKTHNIVTEINSNLKYGVVLDCCGQLNTIKRLKSAYSIQYKIGFYSDPFYDQIINFKELALKSSVFKTYTIVQEQLFCNGSTNQFPQENIDFLEKLYDIVIYPFSGKNEKNWNLDNFKKIYKYFKSRNKTVKFLNPIPCGKTITGVESDDVIVTKDWSESTHQISRSKLLLANDSSIAHIGAYVGVFTLSIFLKYNSEMWFPYPSHKGVAISKENNRIPRKQLIHLIEQKLE